MNVFIYTTLFPHPSHLVNVSSLQCFFVVFFCLEIVCCYCFKLLQLWYNTV